MSSGAKSEASKSEAPKMPKHRPPVLRPLPSITPIPRRRASPRAPWTRSRRSRNRRPTYSRVPCLPPKGGYQKRARCRMSRSKLIAGARHHCRVGLVLDPGLWRDLAGIHISQSPRRELRRQYPHAEIIVLNRGKGGEDAAEMMRRLQTEVIDKKPDLVIWQIGTNAVLREQDAADDRESRGGRHRAHQGARAPTWCWSICNIRRASAKRPRTSAR